METTFAYLAAASLNNDLINLQEKKRERRLSDMMNLLKTGRLMVYFCDNKKVMDIYKKQFEVLDLTWSDSFDQNLDTWKNFLKENPWYSEMSIFVFANVKVKYHSLSLKNVFLNGVQIVNTCLLVNTFVGNVKMDISPTYEVPLCDMYFALASNRTKRKNIYPIMSEAIRTLLDEKEMLTKEYSRFFIPEFTSFLDEQVVTTVFSSDNVAIFDANPDNSYIILVEGDQLLIFNQSELKLICVESMMKMDFFEPLMKVLQDEVTKNLEAQQVFQSKQLNRTKKSLILTLNYNGRIAYLAQQAKKSTIGDIQKFQAVDESVVQDVILEASLQEETEKEILRIGECNNFEEFFTQYVNISPAMVAFLSLFDISSLKKADFDKMDFFSKLHFSFFGMTIRIIESGFSKYSTVTLPYNRKMETALNLIGLRHISPTEYVKNVRIAIETRLANITEIKKNDMNVSCLVYSIHREKFFTEDEVDTIVSAMRLEKSFFEGKTTLLLTEMKGVKLYDEFLNEIIHIPFDGEFLEEINQIQIDVSQDMIEKGLSRIANPHKKYFSSFYLRQSLWKNVVQGSSTLANSDDLTVLNNKVKEDGYPFQFLSKDNIFLNGRESHKIVKHLTAKESMILFHIMAWFPKRTFGYYDVIGKEIINLKEGEDNIWFTDKELEKMSKVKGYKSEIVQRLQSAQSLGVRENRMNRRMLLIDEIYFLGIDAGFKKTIDALLCNLIVFLIYKYKFNQPSCQDKKMKTENRLLKEVKKKNQQLTSYLLKYINVRLGRVSINEVNEEEISWFQKFDDNFLDRDDVTTIKLLR
jgi:hypothetical protein